MFLTVSADENARRHESLHFDVVHGMARALSRPAIRAHVTPSSANRGLRIVAESGDFFRSSYVGLDGAGAAPITEASFKNLPGGEYEVTVTLVDGEGHTTSIDRRFIMVTTALR
jgi:hypothetical protein